ncbi:PREDICTED: DNA-directed RNA polymerase, mitochondrial [Ceratosolen solmsi marchali]|uniref:DNA-directed RNA polymerase n=1 Tax=Ceratosolen solmsi marchali TaxID=326594 RepID=A0AAJ6YUV0_9HYME|nr:PREDICTED: DNA-directed RNA polymerase, mitochondrial [Ceratosolen solmsi marchali]
MYRYFNVPCEKLRNIRKALIVEYLPKMCLFCNLYHRYTPRLLQLRGHSSNTNVIVLNPVKRKKVKRKSKNYAELLEVTDSTTNNTKAAVQKLNVNHFSKLVAQPNFTLDKLDKIYHNDKLLNEKKGAQQKLEKSNSNNLLLYQGHKNYIENLSILPNATVTDAQNKQENVLDSLENNDKLIKVLDNHFSDESELNEISYLADFIHNKSSSERKHKIQPNPQTYAYIFNCIGRLQATDNENLDIFKKIKSELIHNGISLNDVVTKSIFVNDQRMYVEKVAKMLDNQFQPVYSIPDLSYDCTLLTNFTKNKSVLPSTVENLVAYDDVTKLLKKQIKMELDGLTTIYSIAKRSKTKQDSKILKAKVSNLNKIWRKVASDAFHKNLKMLKNIESFKSQQIPLYPYLIVLKPEAYVDIIMRKAQKIALVSEDYSVSYISMCYDTGFQVYQKYEAQVKQNNGVHDKIIQIYKQYCDWFIQRNDKLNCREKWALLAHTANKDGVSTDFALPKWPSTVFAAIGKFLLEILINDFKINKNLSKYSNHNDCDVPAFFKIFRNNGYKMQEQLKPHPLVSQLCKESDLEYLTFETMFVPLLCPPLPWTSMDHGGYILSQSDLIRLNMSYKQRFEKKVNSAPKQLFPALDSLNQLGSVPWTINSKILDIAIQVFQNDGSIKFHIPRPPTVLGPLPHLSKTADDVQKKKIMKARFDLQRKKNEMYSMWCDTLYKLSLANHFKNKIFWLPHNMDFRGRVYPIPPHLNHLGSDLSRSLLIFALKKPLGPKGLDWLKIHAINLTGLKKREPISNRLIYANEILNKILDSAEKPLTGELWWTHSDNPWQTLATCMEIDAVLKSKDPENFISGFPIHQDGSCNGLQHYAALGRDEIGALSVNLHPSDVPQDVYSTVVSTIEDMRKNDIKEGNKIAALLEGHVKRKVIKQTVMTTVYGVTMYGAKLQILRQLKDATNFPEESLWEATMYLSNKTFEALKTMFKGAKEIQDWFSQCSHFICKVRQENMEWVTPLGFPVVQPYANHKQIPKYKLDVKNIYSVFKLKPDSRKQKNAFAPNFIHSLDSSHMMLTSLHCEQEGITFVSVHDCFWTHPCNVEIMNKVCREQFVLLHSQPILNDLSKYFYDNFGFNNSQESVNSNNSDRKLKVKEKYNNVLLKVPKQGDFDIKKVLSSIYFFS